MRRDLDITLLRAFVAIVETGSVTGAARLLNRTQAAVSLQLKRLEDLLEQPLFVPPGTAAKQRQLPERRVAVAQHAPQKYDLKRQPIARKPGLTQGLSDLGLDRLGDDLVGVQEQNPGIAPGVGFKCPLALLGPAGTC